jgi:hypothetical protein
MYPVPGVIVYVWFPPYVTDVAPDGDIVPPVPADDVITGFGRNVAAIVWDATTLINEKLVAVPEGDPTELPSTRILAT